MESVDTQTGQLEDVLASHLPLLRSVVSPRVPAEVADDIVQEVVLAAAKSEQFPAAFREQQNWICRVALRQCALHWRRHARNSGVESFEHTENKTLADPINWLIARESARQIQDAIANLSDESRTVLMRKIVDKFTYEQLAEHLQITRHAAEYKVRVAKKELRSLMQQRGLDEGDAC